jgi:hypothetical protein
MPLLFALGLRGDGDEGGGKDIFDGALVSGQVDRQVLLVRAERGNLVLLERGFQGTIYLIIRYIIQ